MCPNRFPYPARQALTVIFIEGKPKTPKVLNDLKYDEAFGKQGNRATIALVEGIPSSSLVRKIKILRLRDFFKIAETTESEFMRKIVFANFIESAEGAQPQMKHL